MIKLTFLGAIQNVGASGILLEDGKNRTIMDYGVKVSDSPPSFPLKFDGNVTSAFVSHAHLDHSGAIPMLNKKNGCKKIYSTVVTKELSELLLMDSIKVNREEGVQLPFIEQDVKICLNSFETVDYRKPINLKNGVKATLYDAGHIPGSSMIKINTDGKNIVYTGDFNTADTRLIKGCDWDLGDVDVLITESTYSDRNHPTRESQEEELVNIIKHTIANGGNVIVSGFAVGRIDEMLLILDKHGINYPLYVDGMAKKAITIINRHNRILKDPKSMDKVLKNVHYVNDNKIREKVTKKPSVVLTTSGMLKGGPVLWYLKKLHDKSNSSLVLSGFQVEGTPGNVLLKTGQYVNEKYELNLDMKMSVRRLDFSSHVGRDDLLKFIEKMNPQKIFCMHGEKTAEFARELNDKGFEAFAPSIDDRFFEV